MFGRQPTISRILFSAVAALTVGLGVVAILAGFSDSPPLRLLEGVAVFAAGAMLIVGAVIAAMVYLGGWRDPESEEDFERLVVRAELLAEEGLWSDADDEHDYYDEPQSTIDDDEDFKALVRSALDELPLDFHRALEHVAIVVSDGGRRRRAYGLYQGDTVAQDYFHDRIVIFKDTLLRDFGHDPELLKAQVRRTVRHELAHHLGWDEGGVRGLGL
ncbi:MAG: metallopeptidase family protein [Solirubrobacteraceae bacterium]